mgnify:CR=1 FL=1
MLTEKQFPWTGPYFGPSDKRGPDEGPTAEALKRARTAFAMDPSATVYGMSLRHIAALREVFISAVGYDPAEVTAEEVRIRLQDKLK